MHSPASFPVPLQLSSALLFDAVYAVVAAVQELNRSQNVGATQLSCKSSKIWEHGTSLMNYLRMVRLLLLDVIKMTRLTKFSFKECLNILENVDFFFFQELEKKPIGTAISQSAGSVQW